MQTPTMPKYSEQERKIHEAYIKDEILPYKPEFCFCGALAPYVASFAGQSFWHSDFYNIHDFRIMEHALLKTIDEQTWHSRKIYDGLMWDNDGLRIYRNSHPNYENALFNGMVKALEVLKEIHIKKGEIIDSEPIFQKRKLTQSCNQQ